MGVHNFFIIFLSWWCNGNVGGINNFYYYF